MKHITLLTTIAIATLAACDNIDEGARWNKPEPVEMRKNVLVEDFTGQNCVNCPSAQGLLAELSATSMGEHIIAVGIHGGKLAYSSESLAFGLATPLGEEYNKHWGIATWPKGIIDRTGELLDYTAWTSTIISRLNLEPKVTLDVIPQYDANTRQLEITVNIIPTDNTLEAADIAQHSNLTLWLTESGIVAPQTTPEGMKPQYVHNHVLRDAITEPYGEPVEKATQTWKAEDYAYTDLAAAGPQLNFTYTIPTGYGKGATLEAYHAHPENMAIVAFVTYNGQPKDKYPTPGQVIQVIDKKITQD